MSNSKLKEASDIINQMVNEYKENKSKKLALLNINYPYDMVKITADFILNDRFDELIYYNQDGKPNYHTDKMLEELNRYAERKYGI